MDRSSAATVYCNGFPVTAGRDRGGWFCPHCLTRLSDPPGDHVAVPTDGHTSSAAKVDLLARNRKLWLALECAADLLGNDGYADDPDYRQEWRQISEALQDV